MRLALLQTSTDGYHASRRRRVTGFAFAIALEILIILALLTLGVGTPEKKKPDKAVTFSLFPDAETEVAKATPRQQSKSSAAPPASQRAVTPAPPSPTPPAPAKPAPNLLTLDKQTYAGMDISKIKPSGGGEDGDSTGDSKAPYGPGEGPGGQPLYNAEWYREPSRAEMATYVPKLDRTSWGMVACRTIEKYHVENCRELGETPGSGLARAMRLASWQFLVRPPRRGGKALIGAWVRIRFDITVTSVTRGRADPDDKPEPDDEPSPPVYGPQPSR
jgi:protein TonB